MKEKKKGKPEGKNKGSASPVYAVAGYHGNFIDLYEHLDLQGR